LAAETTRPPATETPPVRCSATSAATSVWQVGVPPTGA
jgi:hypothetical protein